MYSLDQREIESRTRKRRLQNNHTRRQHGCEREAHSFNSSAKQLHPDHVTSELAIRTKSCTHRNKQTNQQTNKQT